MNINILLGTLITFIGVIDFIDENSKIARVEISNANEHYQEHIPLWLFPCIVSESDMFHIVQVDGITELRCGEPEPK
jgi:hypothetical protein